MFITKLRSSRSSINNLRGWYQAYFLGTSILKKQLPNKVHTCTNMYHPALIWAVSGPWCPTGSEPHPALIWAPAIYSHIDMAIYDMARRSYGAPNCSFNHLESPHIGFSGSRIKTVAARAINVYSRQVGAAWF